ncbi:MAG: precorrin-6y C5,15-methyltransferase (decarboxylating) subunit CbiE, partial [Candidatus Tectomicrobia bacterium]|nr:precorrin-6y C5,15-methyltransferase (decarboxylating) subunit CbiE [Candidatus Tectomicrobia bacterium]
MPVLGAKVCVIGISAGGAASLSPTLRQRVEAADVLAGGERHLAYFPDFAGERLPIRHPFEAWIEQVAAAADGDRRVVVLATGDPLFYGVGARLVSRLGVERVEIHPHVSSLQMAFARVGVPWEDAAWV